MDHRLLTVLGSGNAVVWFGSGPSVELGLPDWHMLAAKVLEAASMELAQPLPSKIKEAAGKDIPRALGETERFLTRKGKDGRALLERVVRQELADNDNRGDLYTSLASLPVKLYVTTNFDSTFARHIRSERKVVPEAFTNSRQSLEELNPASFDKSIVHLHGSLDHGGHLIITDTDYSRVLQAAEFEALRAMIRAHLVNSPVVILGYSLADPDIKSLALGVAAVFRRRHPVYALVADPDEVKAAQLERDYNIQVIPYSSASKHKELRSVFSATVKWLQAPQVAPVEDRESMRAAQILFVYEAAASSDEPVVVSAVKSLLLVALKNAPEGLSTESCHSSLRDLAGANPDPSLLETAITGCLEEGLVRKVGDIVHLTPDGLARIDTSNRKYDRYWRNLIDDVEMKLGRVGDFGDVLRQVLLRLFSERAAEAVSLAFAQQPIETCSVSLFELISDACRGLTDPPVRHRFIEYVVDLLRHPNKVQRAVIEHLGRSLFCAHALRLDADANELLRSYAAGKTLLLDSNVLIPLLAIGSPKRASLSSLLASAKGNGIRLATTHGFAQEVVSHALWAKRFAEMHADDDALLAAAQGSGMYDGNDFLSGMIITANSSGRRPTVGAYLASTLGAPEPNLAAVRERLLVDHQVSVLDHGKLGKYQAGFREIHDVTREYIGRNPLPGKAPTRMDAEAEVYAFVYEWSRLSAVFTMSGEVAVLSSGCYLNRVAKASPRPLHRSLVITPYALSGFMATYLNPSAIHDFATLVRSEFFNAASDFIEEVDLERFFSGVIAAADRVYREDLYPRLRGLVTELYPEDLPETLEAIPPVQRPAAVTRLTTLITSYGGLSENEELRRGMLKAEGEAQKANLKAKKLEELLRKRTRGERKHKRAHQRRSRKKD